MFKSNNSVGLNFIESLHTTVRSLEICSNILRTIGKEQLPQEILKRQIIKWSSDLEFGSDEYRNQKGRLTINQKPTTAFSHYLDFLNSVDLITKLNYSYRNTRYGLILCAIINNKCEFTFQLSKEEKLFYLLFLFRADSDGLLTALDLIYEQTVSQKNVLDRFKDAFINRLQTKLNIADNFGRIELSEKLRSISVKWKNINKYSEHIIPPRLGWLSSLDIVNIEKSSSTTLYKITPSGFNFLQSLPLINGLIRDIDHVWYKNNSVGVFNHILSDTNSMNWNMLNDTHKNNVFSEAIGSAFNMFGKDGAMRMSLNVTFLYLVIYIKKYHNVLIEFSDVEKILDKSFEADNYVYSLHNAARETESYISIKISK